tara:strand:+ start:2305 stop:2481 length:177 start_codon:yes stop_codon:yes gene_type:complete
VRRKIMNFVFGVIVGVLITIGATNPQWLGSALHWAGDKVETHEPIEIPVPNAGEDVKG